MRFSVCLMICELFSPTFMICEIFSPTFVICEIFSPTFMICECSCEVCNLTRAGKVYSPTCHGQWKFTLTSKLFNLLVLKGM